jgi:hypothetical protein
MEDPIPLVTVSSAIMIVVHSIEVSIMYPHIVISSLAERQENPLFAILYTFFIVWPRDHYMMSQRSTTGVCHALPRFPPQAPLAPCGLGESPS